MPLAISQLLNTATVTSTTPDPNLENNTDSASVDVEILADISVNKSGPLTISAGEAITYTITVTNHGPHAAEDVLLTDPMPSVISNPVFRIGTGELAPWTGAVNLGKMQPNAVLTITIIGVVNHGAPEGQVTNTATVASVTPDPDEENNTSSHTTTVETEADVEIEKVPSRTAVSPGDTLTYTLVVTNHGPSTARAVTVTDPLPAGLLNPTFSVNTVPMGPWTGSYVIGDMPHDDVIEIVITGTVDPDTSFFF